MQRLSATSAVAAGESANARPSGGTGHPSDGQIRQPQKSARQQRGGKAARRPTRGAAARVGQVERLPQVRASVFGDGEAAAEGE